MRRIAAALGIVILLVLAGALLWRVYVHHTRAEPYNSDEPAVVELAKKLQAA
jgi:hypothetical protein